MLTAEDELNKHTEICGPLQFSFICSPLTLLSVISSRNFYDRCKNKEILMISPIGNLIYSKFHFQLLEIKTDTKLI